MLCRERVFSTIDPIISKFTLMQKQNFSKSRWIWMNKNAISKLKLKNRSYHCHLKKNHQQDYKTYAKYRNELKGACKKAIAEYELSLKYASTKLNYSRIIPDPTDGNDTISDNCEKAKTFNMFFASVFTKEADTLPESPLLSIS